MADEPCSNPPAAEPPKPGQRMVNCVKFGQEMPGLDRPPWKGELGKRIYENVSKEAWRMWIEYSKMLINEYRLNPLDPNSQKFIEEQMEAFFFGEGAKLPEIGEMDIFNSTGHKLKKGACRTGQAPQAIAYEPVSACPVSAGGSKPDSESCLPGPALPCRLAAESGHGSGWRFQRQSRRP